MVDLVHVFGGIGHDGEFHVLPRHDGVPHGSKSATGDQWDFGNVVINVPRLAVYDKGVHFLRRA